MRGGLTKYCSSSSTSSAAATFLVSRCAAAATTPCCLLPRTTGSVAGVGRDGYGSGVAAGMAEGGKRGVCALKLRQAERRGMPERLRCEPPFCDSRDRQDEVDAVDWLGARRGRREGGHVGVVRSLRGCTGLWQAARPLG